MINTIILGHALNVLPQLPAESVSCVTCSPPYWGLRDYGIEPVIWDGDKNCKHDFSIETKAGDIRFRGKNSIVGSERNPKVWEGNGKGNFCTKCNAWRGSLGLEPTFELYIKHLCDIFDEVKRVLRKDGTCWVNLGDSYNGGTGYGGNTNKKHTYNVKINRGKANISSKSLCLVPQRFAIEMVNRGWILRNIIIWHKKNCMPSSAKDRFTVDYEPVFFFTKSNKALFWTNEKTLECIDKRPLGTKGLEDKDWEYKKCSYCGGTGTRTTTTKYFIGHDIINCGYCKGSGITNKKVSLWSSHDYWFEQQFEEHISTRWGGTNDSKCKDGGYALPNYKPGIRSHKNDYSPQGRNKRAVWTIPTQPFPEAHFAVYPEALIEPMIRAGCPEFVCKKCGKAKMKIYKSEIDLSGKDFNERQKKIEANIKSGGEKFKRDYLNDPEYRKRLENKKIKIIETDCGCNAGFEGGIVLDPFMGAGTTALVALKQRKRFIGIEIKKEYIDMANKRIAKVQQRIF